MRPALALGLLALAELGGQSINYNASKSNTGNIMSIDGTPRTLHRYSASGVLMGTIASVPNALVATKVLGNYIVSTGTTVVQVTPAGTVTQIATAPGQSGISSQWVTIAADALGNVILGDDQFHAVWLLNPVTGVATKVANYPIVSTSESEFVAVAVDGSGNYLVLEDNGGSVHLYSITPGGSVTTVTLTGVPASNAGSSLVHFNGGYAFASRTDNAIYTLTLTTPLTITSPSAAIAELVGSVAPSGFLENLSVNPDTGDIYVATTAGVIEDIAVKSNGNGVCAPNCAITTIANAPGIRDVITETWADLPHLAAGDIWTTGFYVINTGAYPASYAVNFYDNFGNPVTLPIAGGNASALRGELPANGMTYVEASNPQLALIEGTGLISADPTITVQALFRDSTNGTFYEASVPSSSGGMGFSMPFDFTTFAATGAQLYTGLAIGNLDPVNAAAVTCVATNQAGTVIPNAVIIPAISPLGHFAGFTFPALYGLSGTLNCSSTTRIAAIGVRSLGSTFSTLPVLY